MKKLYSIEGDGADVCYPLEYFTDALNEGVVFNGAKQLVLEVWERDHGTGTFWCKELGEGFESGDGACGFQNCSSYAPRNGKSGRCRWHTTPYFKTEKTITITREAPPQDGRDLNDTEKETSR